MRERRRTRTAYNRRKTADVYFDGNAARRIEAAEIPQRVYVGMPEEKKGRVRKPIECGMTGYTMLFLVISIGIFAGMCTKYLALQSELAQKSHMISQKEAMVNNLKLANDEEYARIMGSVDLEKIKLIAMDELGMTYPSSGQIVSYVDNDSDYVRQYGSIPKK